MTTAYCDRGRPARKSVVRRSDVEGDLVANYLSRCALIAGGDARGPSINVQPLLVYRPTALRMRAR